MKEGPLTGTGTASADLESAIRRADPGARLVAARVVRRVVGTLWRRRRLTLRMPRVLSYAIRQAEAADLLEVDELGPPVEDVVVLIARPDDDEAATPADRLRLAWRRLFEARVRLAAYRALGEGEAARLAARRRIEQLGQVEFDEVRGVLIEEGRLPQSPSDRAAYAEFAACYLGFRQFEPALLARVFPGLADPVRVESLLIGDVDIAFWLSRTRPDASPGPGPPIEPGGPLGSPTKALSEPVSADRAERLTSRAERASGRGNVVRAAVFRWRAAEIEPPRQAVQTRALAQKELNRLVRRLRAALELDDARASEWRKLLTNLLRPASSGTWPVEARLLYDLQTVCVDHERNIYATNLLGWVGSLGRRPIARRLPNQREVLMLKHLRAATRRLEVARIEPADRVRGLSLLREAVEHAEHRLRDRFRPLIVRALERSGWVPANLPERVSMRNSVEELLDRLIDQGQLTMGDVRDALSRGDVKLPDIAGPIGLIQGDPLLRSNRQLTISLDGVYRKGEIYLRLLQRFSALAFGTRTGRFLTLYAALPFGCAYGALVAVQEILAIVAFLIAWLRRRSHPPHVELVDPISVLALGVFLLALIHSPTFRGATMAVLRLTFQPARAALVELPVWLLRRRWVRDLLAGRPLALAIRYVFKPMLAATATVSIARALGDRGGSVLAAGVATGLVAALLLSTRIVREAEEMLVDDLARAWHRFLHHDLPSAYRTVMDFFARIVQQTERLLYSVDEWLRFRSGQRKATLFLKAALSQIWSVAHYVIRIYVNLMVEPTINPIKHFPTVTVAAKLLIPAIPTLSYVVASAAEPFLGKWLAYGLSAITIFFIPGIAGFLVWELKENWRLYEANRSPRLRPAMVGQHGETIGGFLKPGLHSGTLPKLYRRLRKAELRPSGEARRERARHRSLQAIRHAEESLAHFLERRLVFFLREGPPGGGTTVRVSGVSTSTNRVRLDLSGPPGAPPARLAFEVQSGYLIAWLERPGWLAPRSGPSQAEARSAIEAALAGLYARAGVQLVRNWLRADLAPHPFDIDDRGLVAWPGNGDVAILYDLEQSPRLRPMAEEPDSSPVPTDRLPDLLASRVRFDASPISWPAWVAFWEGHGSGPQPPPPFTTRPLLPPG